MTGQKLSAHGQLTPVSERAPVRKSARIAASKDKAHLELNDRHQAVAVPHSRLQTKAPSNRQSAAAKRRQKAAEVGQPLKENNRRVYPSTRTQGALHKSPRVTKKATARPTAKRPIRAQRPRSIGIQTDRVEPPRTKSTGTQTENTRPRRKRSRFSTWLESVPAAYPPPLEDIEEYGGGDDDNDDLVDSVDGDPEMPLARGKTANVPIDSVVTSTGQTTRSTPASIPILIQKLQNRNADPSGEDPHDSKIHLFSGLKRPHTQTPLQVPIQTLRTQLTKSNTKLEEAHTKGMQELPERDVEQEAKAILEAVAPHQFLFTVDTERFSKDKHRRRLPEEIDWDCERQWTPNDIHALPRRPRNPQLDPVIKAPKPDLALYFRKSYIQPPGTRKVGLSEDLEPCISPDGVADNCFPFLFIEAKRGDDSLKVARVHNMLSASQALNNIYTCMDAVGQREIFFRDVRVFSIAINAEDAEVRIHRAKDFEAHELVKQIDFVFQTVETYKDYTRNELCSLVQTIINVYAKTVLLPTLKATYKLLIEKAFAEMNRSLHWTATLPQEQVDEMAESESQVTQDNLVNFAPQQRVRNAETSQVPHPVQVYGNGSGPKVTASKLNGKKKRSKNSVDLNQKPRKKQAKVPDGHSDHLSTGVSSANNSFGASGLHMNESQHIDAR